MQKESKRTPKGKNNQSTNQMKDKEKAVVPENNSYTDLPPCLQLVWIYVSQHMKDDQTIKLRLQEDILGSYEENYLTRIDILEFISMSEISAPCVLVYLK